MAYSIGDLLNRYNANDASMLARAIMTKNGFLEVCTSYEANKQMSHYYGIGSTVPAGVAHTINTGDAFSNTTNSYATLTLTAFVAPTAVDAIIYNPQVLADAGLRQITGLGSTI